MAGVATPSLIYDNIDGGKTLNKEGLLELSSQIKSYINANSGGGGSSYTAGNGIEIDENGVISNIIPNDIAVNLLYLSLLGIPDSRNEFTYNYVTFNRTTTSDEVEDCLQQGKGFLITTQPRNVSMNSLLYEYGIRQVIKIADNGTITVSTIASNAGWTSANNWLYMRTGAALIGVPSHYGVRSGAGIVDKIYYNNTDSGLIASTIKEAIDEIVSNLNTRIPTAPTADGAYVLKCVVSSGIPNYSWIAE